MKRGNTRSHQGISKEFQLPVIQSQAIGAANSDDPPTTGTPTSKANKPAGRVGGRPGQGTIRRSPTKPLSQPVTLTTQSLQPFGFPGGVTLSTGYGFPSDNEQVKGQLSRSPINKQQPASNEMKGKNKLHAKRAPHSKQLNSLSGKSNGHSPLPANNAESPLPSQKKVLPDIKKKSHYMTGGMHELPPQKSNIIRIFLSSTFSDMKAERNTLAKYAYPELKNFCRERGLEFQVVDMRWGVTDEATNDHSVENLCLEEIRKCQRLSAGPNFVAMTGNRYGFQPIRPTIPADEFEPLLQAAVKLKLAGCHTLTQWYIKDDNAVPPLYILQPINTILEHYGDKTAGNEEMRKNASCEWMEISAAIRNVLQQAATEIHKKGVISEEKLHDYFVSVTEIEIAEGIFKSETESIWISREMKDLLENLDTPKANRYTDTLVKDGKVLPDESVEALKKEVNNKMKEKILHQNHKHFTLAWQPGGIDPDIYTEHSEYVHELCDFFTNLIKKFVVDALENVKGDVVFDDFRRIDLKAKPTPTTKTTNHLKTNIKKVDGILPFGFNQNDMFKNVMAVQQVIKDFEDVEKSDFNPSSSQIRTPEVLASEVLHHMSFCHTKCSLFCGRTEELAKMKEMMSTNSRSQPIMVYAPSGCGKTAFMAKVAQSTKSWFGENCVTIARFLGTSPSSSSIRRVLINVIKQLCTVYKLPIDQRKFGKMSSVVQYFNNLLIMLSFGITTSSSVLTILFDSVDQLDRNNGAHTFGWLPEWCPQNVNIVVSFIPSLYNCLENAKKRFSKSEDVGTFLKLESLSESTMTAFIDTHLTSKHRKISEKQADVVLKAYRSEPKPLFMKLLLDEAAMWRSYTPNDSLQLADSIRGAIKLLLRRFEQKFGEVFVCYALGYLTIGRGGLSEVELEDVLSCNDQVLNSVYQYHPPPVEGVVRIPPLLCSRLKHDLGDYVIERKTMGMTTIFWYHRQFVESVSDEYIADGASHLHADLTNIYAANQSIKKTVTLESCKKTIENADRQLMPQPMNVKNQRKLTSLPYHVARSADVDLIKKTLFNMDFINCRIKAFSIMDLLEDFQEALDHLGQDKEIEMLRDCVRFSDYHIKNNMSELPVQILGQAALDHEKDAFPYLNQIASQCQKVLHDIKTPLLEPMFRCIPTSTSSLKWYLEGPTEIMTISQDKRFALLYNLRSVKDKSPVCRVLKLSALQVVQTLNFKSEDNDIRGAVFTNDNQRVILLCKENVFVYSVSNGNELFQAHIDIRHAGLLNCMVSISSDDKQMVLASPDRLGIMTDQGKSANEPRYVPRRAMSYSGCVATTNLTFVYDDSMVLSSHTVQSEKVKGRKFGVVCLWDYENKETKARIPIHSGPVVPGFLYATQSPDVKVCGSTVGVISILNLKEGKVVNEINADSSFLCSCFDVTSSILCAVTSNHKLEMWKGAEPLLNDHYKSIDIVSTSAKEAVSSVLIIRDGELLVTSSGETLKIYSVQKESQVVSIMAHDMPIKNLVCTDYEILFSSSADAVLKLWSIDGLLEEAASNEAKSETNANVDNRLCSQVINDFLLSNNGEFIITSSDYIPPRVWKAKSGELVRTMEGQSGTKETILFCSDNIIVGREIESDVVKMWNVETGQQENFIEMRTDTKNLISFSHTFDLFTVLYLLGDDMKLDTYDLNKKDLCSSVTLQDSIQNVAKIHVTKDDKYCLILTDKFKTSSGSLGYKVKFTSLTDSSGKVYPIQAKDNRPGVGDIAEEIQIFSVQDNDKQSALLFGCQDNVLTWKPGQPFCEPRSAHNRYLHRHGPFLWADAGMKGYTEDVPITALQMSADHQISASGASNGTLIGWLHNTESKIRKDLYAKNLIGHSGAVTSILMVNDGHLLITGSKDKTVRVWETVTCKNIYVVHVHAQINKLTLSQDNQHLFGLIDDKDGQKLIAFKLINFKSGVLA